MARVGSSLAYGGGPNARWTYTMGFFAHALEELGNATRNHDFSDFGSRLVDSFVAPDGSIRTYRAAEYSLDEILPGRALLDQDPSAAGPRIRKAEDLLRHQLSRQPRTPEGAFWHKGIYPMQMWLDGLYMAGPFYAAYGRRYADSAALSDARRQLILADQHLYDPSSGLYFHAWDSSRRRPWADPASGHSPSFWGRALGWYAMAVADEIGDLGGGPPLPGIYRRIAAGIVRWQDKPTGVWWQVVDQGGRAGNYRESSASCMFVYALSKGVNEGYLRREPNSAAARRGFDGILHAFVTVSPDGSVSLGGCCGVAGLDNRNAAGAKRDGSYGYYVSEPIAENDLKAVSAFILAGIELQRMTAPSQ
jgi:unsaturated rhamnogalacturonyl hydrolase